MEFVAVRHDLIYEDLEVRLSSLLDPLESPSLAGFTFNRCRIIGPAVLHVIGHVYLAGCEFEAPGVAAMLWEIPAGAAKVGAIEIRDTSFRRCSFEDVGFVGTAEELAGFSGMLES